MDSLTIRSNSIRSKTAADYPTAVNWIVALNEMEMQWILVHDTKRLREIGRAGKLVKQGTSWEAIWYLYSFQSHTSRSLYQHLSPASWKNYEKKRHHSYSTIGSKNQSITKNSYIFLKFLKFYVHNHNDFKGSVCSIQGCLLCKIGWALTDSLGLENILNILVGLNASTCGALFSSDFCHTCRQLILVPFQERIHLWIHARIPAKNKPG